MTDERIEKLLDEFIQRMRKPPLEDDQRAVIRGYVISGITELNGYALEQDVDYEADRLGHELLYNYVFYCDNDCRDKFEGAYRGMIMRFRFRSQTGYTILCENEGNDDAQN